MLLDLYLSKTTIQTSEYKLTGLSCLRLAAKLDEVNFDEALGFDPCLGLELATHESKIV